MKCSAHQIQEHLQNARDGNRKSAKMLCKCFESEFKKQAYSISSSYAQEIEQELCHELLKQILKDLSCESK
ncbi:hypothetical protein ACOJUR_14080 [Alicyclobacillus tolerans]|uniref:Uncharacterized protein n=1 Tax=Alicyclobacillus tolerans TaxID=90970 RepID=A0ABT9M091_9BACL|nr:MULTISPECIES: hypothetical protein [Alicyclobacillus]MDP9729937.1 hypothetical protein [Alicyclobacillus tengchongensis]QRF24921.1 hypothetical protein FY534_14200 [Alicyclobacillus sp. TC]QRF24932.1 hypothetical protein FY534_14255 [Alicyclobacillus sp. TC]